MENIKHEISIEEIRHTPGFEKLSDEELQDIVNNIKELALILAMIQLEEKSSKK